MLQITLKPVGDLDALGSRWRALEARSDAGFFRSWTFLGCLAAERFGQARLLTVSQDGCDVSLALLGQRGGRLWLNQTGDPAQDSPFIEHNGLLTAQGEQYAISMALRHVARLGPALVLSGVDDETLAAADEAGWLSDGQSRNAPAVDLTSLGGVPYLQTLSAGARAQIRRSRRLYGPDLRLERAPTVADAQAWFDEMVRLHQTSWSRRGRPGAFALAATRRFHRTLIARAWPRGEADLLRVQAGNRVVGLLYTLQRDGHVLSYQSGFDYDRDRPREKPGLVCHALAIEHYATAGARLYDLLAGPERYKLTLAKGGTTLYWTTLHRAWSGAWLAVQARRGATRLMTALSRNRLQSGPDQAA